LIYGTWRHAPRDRRIRSGENAGADAAAFDTWEDRAIAEMHPPIEYVQIAPAELPAAGKVDVFRHIPTTATRVIMIVTVLPPTGSALVYAPGYENYAVLFKGPKSSGEVRIAGPFLYVQLIDGATTYDIQYLGWNEPQ
jgi:hypothetical protein